MVKSAASEDGWVNHLDTIRHPYNQNVTLYCLRDPAKEFGNLFDSVVAALRRVLSVREECLHLVNHQNGWSGAPRFLEHPGYLASGLVDVRTSDCARVDGKARPPQVLGEPFDCICL